MASADELKALGNKAIAEKNFDEAVAKFTEAIAIQPDRTAGKQVLRYFFERSTPGEQKWIIRIILKELKIGMTERVILPLFHPNAYELFSHCSNLQKVCTDLRDPMKRISNKIELQLFHPFRPMLGKRLADTRTVVHDMDNHSFWIEKKLDGERMQLHKKRDEYRYWSRKAKEYTHLYGSDKTNGSLTPYIDSCILDGEMIEYDPLTKTYMPFGTLKTAAADHSQVADNKRPCFVAFDVLYVNGDPKVDLQLQDRYKLLDSIITEQAPGRFEILPHTEGDSVKHVTDALEKVVEESGEGILVKNPKSRYEISERPKHWLKVKPEYIDALSEEFDVLCVGGYFGKGRRAGIISHFLCAVRDEQPHDHPGEDDGEREPGFLTFCKVGSGYTDEVLKSIK